MLCFRMAGTPGGARALCEEMQSTYGVRCVCFPAALEAPGNGKRFFDEAVEFLGGLGLLVNNAGVTILQSIVEMPEESIDYLIDLDFRNYIILMRHAIRYMEKHGTKESVINITSSRGQRAYPGDAVYGRAEGGPEPRDRIDRAGCGPVWGPCEQRCARRGLHPQQRENRKGNGR